MYRVVNLLVLVYIVQLILKLNFILIPTRPKLEPFIGETRNHFFVVIYTIVVVMKRWENGLLSYKILVYNNID